MKRILILSIMVFSSFVFGLSWSPISTPGLGNVYNTQLFPGPVDNGFFYFGTYNDSTGGQLFRTFDGVDFTAISGDGFGIGTNNNPLKPFPVIVSNDLYVFSDNNATGFQVWKSTAGTGAPGSWVKVVSNGFGYGYYASKVAGSAVYNNALYVGFYENTTYNPHIKSLSLGAQNWTEISSASNYCTNPRPEGVYNGYLYVSELSLPKLWRYNGSWETITTNGFNDASIDSFLPAYEGFNNYIYVGGNSYSNGAQIWRSTTGEPGTWSKIFDFNTVDTNNREILSFSIPGDGYLYFSTYNPNGTEVWRTAGGTSDFEQVNEEGFVQGNQLTGTNTRSILARYLFNGTLIAGTMNGKGGSLYGTPITIPNTIPANVKKDFPEDALKILGSSVPGLEGTFDPAKGEALLMTLEGVNSGSVHFRIFTLTGETIFDGEVTSDAQGHFKLDIPSDIASGVYIIEVNGPNFHFTKKLAVLQ